MDAMRKFDENPDDGQDFDFDSIDDHIAILESTPEISDAIEKGADLRQFAARVSAQLYDETLHTMEEYVEHASEYASLWKTLKETEEMFNRLHTTLLSYNADLRSTAISIRALTETTIEKDTQIENRRNALEYLNAVLPLIKIPPNLTAILSSPDCDMPLFVQAVRRAQAITSALNDPTLFPPNSALRRSLLPELEPAAVKASARLCSAIAAHLARLSEDNTNVRIALRMLSRRFDFAPGFIAQFGGQHRLEAVLGGHITSMGQVVATRVRNTWREIKDQGSLLTAQKDDAVVPKGTFDSKTGKDSKLPRVKGGEVGVDDARLAVRAMLEREGELLMDPVFVSTRAGGKVTYPDALGRVLCMLVSDLRAEAVFLRTLFRRTDAQLEQDCEILLHTHRGGGFTSAMPNMLHGVLHLSSSASGVVHAVLQSAVKDNVVNSLPMLVLCLRVVAIATSFCKGGWEVPRPRGEEEVAQAARMVGRAATLAKRSGGGAAKGGEVGKGGAPHLLRGGSGGEMAVAEDASEGGEEGGDVAAVARSHVEAERDVSGGVSSTEGGTGGGADTPTPVGESNTAADGVRAIASSAPVAITVRTSRSKRAASGRGDDGVGGADASVNLEGGSAVAEVAGAGGCGEHRGGEDDPGSATKSHGEDGGAGAAPSSSSRGVGEGSVQVRERAAAGGSAAGDDEVERVEMLRCPAPLLSLLEDVAEQLWAPYKALIASHLTSLRAARPMVEVASAHPPRTTMDNVSPSHVVAHVVVARYAVLIADIHKANAPVRANAINSAPSQVAAATSEKTHGGGAGAASPAGSAAIQPMRIGEAAASAASEALGVANASEDAVDAADALTEVSDWSPKVTSDLEHLRLEALQLIHALADRCAADPHVRTLYLVNAYSCVEDALVSRTVPPTNSDRRVFRDLLAQQCAGVQSMLLARSGLKPTLDTLGQLTDELLASFTPQAFDANHEALGREIADRLPALASDFAERWSKAVESSAAFLAQYVPSRTTSRMILCGVMTVLLDRNARLWATSRACWSNPPFLPRLVSNQRITAEVRNRYASSLAA